MTSDMSDREKKLTDHNRFLGERLRGEKSRADNLAAELTRLAGLLKASGANESSLRTELRTARSDLKYVHMPEGMRELLEELNSQRLRADRLRLARDTWQDLTRRAVENKKTEAQRARDLDAVVEELREKLTEAEKQRDETAKAAEEQIAARDAQRNRIVDQGRLWKSGRLAAHDAIAGIEAEVGGYPMDEPGWFERARATESARTTSELNQALKQLGEINGVLDRAGIESDATNSTVRRVVFLRRAVEANRAAVEEWKSREAAARGAATRLARRFHCGDEVVQHLVTGRNEDAFKALDDREKPVG